MLLNLIISKKQTIKTVLHLKNKNFLRIFTLTKKLRTAERSKQTIVIWKYDVSYNARRLFPLLIRYMRKVLRVEAVSVVEKMI